MIRDVDIRDISDGRRYRSSDLVKLDTLGCQGCSRCCRESDDTIRLDPMDLYWLQTATGCDFEQLLSNEAVSLSVVDGLVLPHLNMAGGRCHFLDESGRCQIHDYRPDFCRLFPLGRIYEDGTFSYFVQIHECDRMSAKIRIRKWLGIPDLPRYEAYIQDWHDFTMNAVAVVQGLRSEKIRSRVCTKLLAICFARPWETEQDFYAQYEARMQEARHLIGRA